jgi:colanic acid biosynthesis glycosyl transferase WcaI
MKPSRIVIHDYSGHSFLRQFSTELARRGHEVLHVFSTSLPSTPQGTLHRLPTDPPTLHLAGVDLGYKIQKQSFAKVFFHDEPRHAEKAIQLIREFRPDYVAGANTPPKILTALQRYCWESAIPFVFWSQDLYGEAARRILPEKLGFAGKLAGDYLHRLEHTLFRRSGAIIVISDDFRPYLPKCNVPVTTIENWAPLEELPPQPRQNPWSDRHGLSDTLNLIYSGTLGLKHNPELLVKVAQAQAGRREVRVVVISQGAGMDYLTTRKEELGLDNLVLLPFQPFPELPQVLASADVLCAILEPDAGVFSVPSKVLSYLCAGRALLLGVPPENLASRIVAGQKAGEVVNPTDEAAFVAAADRLLSDHEGRVAMGQAARSYAERTFDVQAICARFEEVLVGAQRR